jgi:hypothetical protein
MLKRLFPNLDAGKLMVAPIAFVTLCLLIAAPFTVFQRLMSL